VKKIRLYVFLCLVQATAQLLIKCQLGFTFLLYCTFRLRESASVVMSY